MMINTRAVMREPLLHFVVLAAALFMAGHYWGDTGDSNRYRITVTPQEIQHIADGYHRQYGAVPSSEQLRHLTDRYVREEILYREGLAMGLDREDEIIRRRIVQKVGFLEQDLSVVRDPTAEALAAYYRAHQDKYQLPERRSFTHVYFSPDRDGDAGARSRALNVLRNLRSTHVVRAPNRGDVFAGPSDYSLLGAAEADRVFGKSEFSASLFIAPVGQWSGPYRSGYGWHLLYVQGVEAPKVPPLAELLDTVRADYIEEVRKRSNDEQFSKLSAKYTIVRPDSIPALGDVRVTPVSAGSSGTD